MVRVGGVNIPHLSPALQGEKLTGVKKLVKPYGSSV
jgi:hypothetical protein